MSTPLDRALDGDASQLFRDEEERATFLRRLKRSFKRKVHQNSVEEFLDRALRIDDDDDDFPFSLSKLERIVEDFPESKTAMGMLESALCCVVGSDALESGDAETAASAFAEAYRKNSMVVRWDFSKMHEAKSVFLGLYTDSSGRRSQRIRAEALFVHANLLFLQRQHQLGLKQIQLARLLLPEDPYFPAVEGNVWAMLREKDKAREALQRAADLGCDDPADVYFHRAVLLDSSAPDQNEINLLESFVNQANPDSRKLPEACYRLALLHGYRGPRYLGEAKRCYDRGQQADKDHLPCFPDECSQWRDRARALVKRYLPCGNPKCTSHGSRQCTACGQIVYCDEECQKAHWPFHKAFCKQKHGKKKKKKSQA